MTEKIDYSTLAVRCGSNAASIVKAMEDGNWGVGSTALIMELANLGYRPTLRALHRLMAAGLAEQCESVMSRCGWAILYHRLPQTAGRRASALE